MRLQYGNYEHDIDEVWFDIFKTPIYSETGLRRGHRETWVINGYLKADSVANLTSAMLELRNGYGQNRGNLGFYEDDGTPTDHILNDSETIGGTRVVDFRWLDSRNAEYVRYRSYRVVVEADIVDSGAIILQWRERIQRIGSGGPIDRWIWTLNGAPQKQRVNQQSTYRTIQMGWAVGQFDYPTIATPISVNDLHQERTVVSPQTPRYADGDRIEFPIYWRYEFESANALTGVPTNF
jgi:hypothetical protein